MTKKFSVALQCIADLGEEDRAKLMTCFGNLRIVEESDKLPQQNLAIIADHAEKKFTVQLQDLKDPKLRQLYYENPEVVMKWKEFLTKIEDEYPNLIAAMELMEVSIDKNCDIPSVENIIYKGNELKHFVDCAAGNFKVFIKKNVHVEIINGRRDTIRAVREYVTRFQESNLPNRMCKVLLKMYQELHITQQKGRINMLKTCFRCEKILTLKSIRSQIRMKL